MRTISDIYSEYTIMPNLALHQLRVAAVAKHILDALKIHNRSVISACLLHDMGNMIKFRLTDFPEFLEPQGLEYWEKVKSAMVEKYGAEEHLATVRIAEEIGISEETMACLNAVGFTKTIQNLQAPLAHKICAYADMRVGPKGVLTLQERFDDGRKRYANRTDRTLLEVEKLEALYVAGFELEKQIFEGLALKPEEITDSRIEQEVETLKEWEIETT